MQSIITAVKTAENIEALNISYKKTQIDTPFENDMKGYELYLNGEKTYLILTKCDTYWIAYNMNQSELALRKATEHLASDTLREAKEVIVRMLNIQFCAKDWFEVAQNIQDPTAKLLAYNVADSVLEYNAPQQHLIEKLNDRLDQVKTAKKQAKELKELESEINEVEVIAKEDTFTAYLLDKQDKSKSTAEKNLIDRKAQQVAQKMTDRTFTIYLKNMDNNKTMEMCKVNGSDLYTEMKKQINLFRSSNKIQVRFI